MACSALADLADFVRRRLRRVATSGSNSNNSGMESLDSSIHAAMHSEQSRAIFDRTRNGSVEQTNRSGADFDDGEPSHQASGGMEEVGKKKLTSLGAGSDHNNNKSLVSFRSTASTSSSHALAANADSSSTTMRGDHRHSRAMLPPIQNTTKARFAAMLYCAVFDGDLVVARRMIEFLHSITEERLGLYLDRDEKVPFLSSPFTIIHYAVASQSVEMLQLILFFLSDVQKITGFVDVNVSSAPPHSCAPLHFAVALAHFDMVRTLLASNARARACRGPRSTRVSALQDALYGMVTAFPSELDALVHAPAEPLYSQSGITVPPRHANRMAPWLLWVKHGVEERAKIPRGAWRVDTNSFIRSRTPSPEHGRTRKQYPPESSVSVRVVGDDSSADGGGAPLVAAADEAAVPSASHPTISQPTRTTERLTPSRMSDDSEHSAHAEALSNTSGTGSLSHQQQQQQGRHRSTSPPHPVTPWKSWRHQLCESSLFRIAVLLLDQGAELIFQKAGLRHAEVRRLQQVTALVQKEFNRKLQLHEDAGLAQIMREDTALQAAMQQHESGVDVGDDHNDGDVGEQGSGPHVAVEREGSSSPHRPQQQQDDENGGVVDRTRIPAQEARARDAKKSNAHKRAPMASLVASVTPTHPLFLKAVIAHRVREAHAQRLHVLQQRLPTLLAPLGSRKPVRVGDAVWVKEGSRYCPKPRHPLALLKAGVPTPMLMEAANDLVRNRYLAERVYHATIHLLGKPLTNLDDDSEGDDGTYHHRRSLGQHHSGGEGHSFHERSTRRHPHRSITTSTTSCSSDYPPADVSRGEEFPCGDGAAVELPLPLRGQQHPRAQNHSRALTPVGVPKILIGGVEATPDELHPQHRPQQQHLLPLVVQHQPQQRGFPNVTDEASLVRMPETSTQSSSHRSAVFSQSLMVGRPEVVVGCVACIVSIPDVAVQALEDALDSATSCGANLSSSTNENGMDGEVQARAGHSPRHRLFAGLVVEPRYGTSSSGSLLPAVLQRGGRSDSERGVGALAGISILSDVVHPNTSNAGPPLLAKDVECTLPYCSLFVPLSDITVVRQHTAADVAVHRLRKEVNRLAAGLKIATFEDEHNAEVARGDTHLHQQHSRQPGDAHKMMFRCLQKQRELRLAAEQAVRNGV